MATIAETLAGFVVDAAAADIPLPAMERAAMCISSTIASAAMGHAIASAAIIRDLEKDSSSIGVSKVWFDGALLSAIAAARVNVVASAAAASDDSDMRGIAHIGECVCTTGIAVGEQLGSSGKDVLCAMVLGYEVAGRIDEALVPGRLQKGFHGCISAVFGAACTAAKLLGLDKEQTGQAISLAATSIGGLSAAADTSWAREYHSGMAVMNGMQAALAAKRNYIGEIATLEKPRGYLETYGAQHWESITSALGEEWDIVTDMAIKLMPGAHPLHAIAEAAANAAVLGDVRSAEVARIVVTTGQLHDLSAFPKHPRNLVDMAHSLSYFVACSVNDRKFDWSHTSQSSLCDTTIAALQDLVELDPSPVDLPDRFPYRHGASVSIYLRSGECFTGKCTAPRGMGTEVEWSDVDAKYRELIGLSCLSTSNVEESLQVIHGFLSVRSTSELTKFF